ncbi:methylated-DNA--[protein]-cysteine S-methyltransferase [Bacillus mangrovi]|uniref:Methylated-DNA--protein-cysteine methyltransferase n=1 Tax=Metabacillus mangrovi TaxID=1491830 RepID=A0A7X2S284_9BACI|nr:methylated-DNA--[protein]-cysteine S-methyltransferase [Metabacillus mangrovi]MTH51940.1 methylated-DNA--[protein]-cysteine S-methyltransferase [Metabacillus mangrovi]
MDQAIYYDEVINERFSSEPFYLAATDQGVCRITWPGESADALERWSSAALPGSSLVYSPEKTMLYIRQLKEYLNGERRCFQLPLDLYGTPFQISVWRALQLVPYGTLTSYRQLAMAAGNEKAVRAAGTANGKNPVPIIVPCHRVIGSDGSLTGFRGGLQMKERLLNLEGISDFSSKGHKRFQF